MFPDFLLVEFIPIRIIIAQLEGAGKFPSEAECINGVPFQIPRMARKLARPSKGGLKCPYSLCPPW